MSALIRIAIVLVIAASPAFAEPMRVLLADSDPELQRAVKATLAPWHLDVVVDSEHTDATNAQMRGETQTARFVVWRENGELVVFDRERGEAEHREAPAGPLDPVSAAAAALTVKTLMRLPPPGQVADTTPTTTLEPSDQITKPARDDSGVELRAQAGVAARRASASELDGLGTRGSLALFVKPTDLPLRFGIAGELGTSSEVKDSGFRGTWRDWSVIGLASWAFALGPRWEIEPYVGAGVLRSNLDGDEGMMERHERDVLAIVRGGTFVRLRMGHFSLGAAVNADAITGTPTYTRGGMGTKFFEVPPFAVSIGFFAAADLTR